MHEFDLGSSNIELAKEIVGLPDGFDFAETNLNKVLLLGKPEERNPVRYADIFFTIVKLFPKASPWMRYASQAEEINGLRRAKGADMLMLADNLDDIIKFASDNLPNEKNKFIFLGGSYYNVGLIRRGLRRYQDAVSAQRQASAWYGLAGNTEKQLVYLFVATVEEVTATFVNRDWNAINRSIFAMIAMRDHIRSSFEVYPAWMEQNASIHIGWALVMACVAGIEGSILFPQYDADFQMWKDNSTAQWKRAALVIESYFTGYFSETVKQTSVDIHSSSADNAGLTVKIFVALAHRGLSNEAECKKILTDVMNHAGSDGGIPIAIATRLLEK